MRTRAEKREMLAERLTLAFQDTAAAKALAVECGVRAMPKADGGASLAVSFAHTFLARAFADTQWCGAWRDALVELPGARLLRPLKALVIPRKAIDAILYPAGAH